MAAGRSWPSTSVDDAKNVMPSSISMAAPAAVRLGRSRGRSRRLWYARSLVCRELDERPDDQDVEDEAREEHRRQEHLEGDGVAPADPLPAGHDAQRPVEPAHVPVGLDGVGDLVRLVLAELPDGVDLREAAQQEDDRR